MKLSTARRRFVAAFTLVEVALAMGVASFCLIVVLGLVPIGVETGQMAADQTAAGSILTHVLSDLRATPTTTPAGGAVLSTQYALQIPASGAGASSAILYFGDSVNQFSKTTTLATSRYRLTVNFLPSVGGRAATGVSLQVSWPARVDPSLTGSGGPTGRVQVFAALDRN